MNKYSLNQICNGILVILLTVSAIVITSGSIANQYMYWGPIACVLLLIILITTWQRMYGTKNALTIFAVGYAIITAMIIIGHKTFWPFGQFQYTQLMGFQILNIVPWTIPIIWLLIICATVPLTRREITGTDRERYIKLFSWAFDAALLATAIEFILEPAVIKSGIKLVMQAPSAFGVPIQHTLGFFIVSIIITSIVIAFAHKIKESKSEIKNISVSVLALMGFFIVWLVKLNLAVVSVTGLILCVWLVLRIRNVLKRHSPNV